MSDGTYTFSDVADQVWLSPDTHIVLVIYPLMTSEMIIPLLFFIKGRLVHSITKTCLFGYTENFNTKSETSYLQNSNIFHISAQNIDCRYSLEPPQRGGSKEYQQSMFFDQK